MTPTTSCSAAYARARTSPFPQPFWSDATTVSELDERPRELGRGLGVVALDAEHHEVHRSHRCGIARGGDARDGLLIPAHDRHAVGIDPLDQRSRHVDEHGVVATLDEACAEDCAHRSGPDNGDLHLGLLCFLGTW